MGERATGFDAETILDALENHSDSPDRFWAMRQKRAHMPTWDENTSARYWEIVDAALDAQVAWLETATTQRDQDGAPQT